MRQQDRLLNLVMSQILDQHVAKMLSDVRYECTKDTHCDITNSFIITKSAPGGETEESEMSDQEEPTTTAENGSAAAFEDQGSDSVENDSDAVLKNNSDSNLRNHTTSGGEHDKENIEKSSTLKCTANTSMEVISAAS